MLSTIRMPQMGVSDESAILSKWLVREGDRIRRGQPVFSLETDKATFQYEAESDGVLVRILTGEGEEAAVGSPVGVLLSDSEEKVEESELEALLNGMRRAGKMAQVRTGAETNRPKTEVAVSSGNSIPAQAMPDAGQRISPRARKTANELGVNWKDVHSGSGPGGRILERDVLNAAQTNRAIGEIKRKTNGIYSGRPLTQTDRVSIRPIHAENTDRTGFVSRLVDARNILAQCTPKNELTPDAMICHELARLLVRAPELNARRHGDRIYEYNTVHLRLAVETPAGTLKPVIRCAEVYTADELAVLMRNAAERCARFDSKPQEFQDGTFTVADLSGYGTDCFTPELTPPALCALGIGSVTTQTRFDSRGGIEAYPAIRLTLAYDRAGADALRAAGFLNELAFRLEQGGTQQ